MSAVVAETVLSAAESQNRRHVTPSISGDIDIVVKFPVRRKRQRLMTAAEAWDQHFDDIEAATAAASYVSVQAFKTACFKRKVDLGEFAYGGAQKEKQSKTATDEPWTNEARLDLANLWLQRPMLSVTEISRRLGRTTAALQTAVSRFGLPGREAMPLDELAAVRRIGRFRGCMTCGQQFFSTGPGRPLCEQHHGGDGLP